MRATTKQDITIVAVVIAGLLMVGGIAWEWKSEDAAEERRQKDAVDDAWHRGWETGRRDCKRFPPTDAE